jgi:oligosaccharyl transferase (archaeosortase A-associated)
MKFLARSKYGVALFAVFLIALFLRIYFNHSNIFASGWVNFQETDCWYQMRQVEILARNFPHRMLFDPYNFYPGGMSIGSPPFFYLLIGFFAWVFGAGSPTQKVIETVGAYLPAILGALVTVPVYVIGRELFSRKAGLMGAALIAILPGQFLWRSMLGFPDYHVAETLFSATAMMFLILALKSSRERDISFQSLWRGDWGVLRRPFAYCLLTGIALGLYLLTWPGGGLFIFIIFVFAVIQLVIDHLRGNSTDYLCIATGVSFLIALFMVSVSWNGYGMWNLQFAALLVGILAFLVLGVISFLMTTRHMRRIWYPAALVGLGAIGAALFYLADPSLFRSILDKVSWLAPSAGMRTVAEMQRLTISAAWEQFTTCLYLALISLVIIAYLVIRKGAAEKTLLLIWSLVIAIAAFSENRFAYYFVVNVAVLTAYLSWRALQFAGLREAPEGIEVTGDTRDGRMEKEKWKSKRGKKAKGKKGKARQREQAVSVMRYLNPRNVYVSITLLVVFFFVFYPNIGLAIDRVKANTGVDNDWHESLVWLKDHTPDPFNNPDFYYELYQRQSAGGAYQFPESAYGVMSWWDYGYFITYIAHRIPNANPSQGGAPDAALFFTGQDEASTGQILDRLGSKYVIIDASMVIGKFYAMATWAGKDQSQFFEVFYESTQTGTLQPVMLYYPEYYQSMCARLYLFGGQQWVPQQTVAISWSQRQLTSTDGSTFQAKVITDQQSFSTYDSAKAFVDAHTDYRIVGSSQVVSPVPLEKLEHYKLIHQSPTVVATQQGGNGTISAVEIFEYSP